VKGTSVCIFKFNSPWYTAINIIIIIIISSFESTDISKTRRHKLRPNNICIKL